MIEQLLLNFFGPSKCVAQKGICTYLLRHIIRAEVEGCGEGIFAAGFEEDGGLGPSEGGIEDSSLSLKVCDLFFFFVMRSYKCEICSVALLM